MMNKHSFSAVESDISKQRSSFDIPHRHLTTANFGRCVPFYCMEVLPGDTFNVHTNMFVRMSTPLYPVMDDAYVEYNYFFVPMRLVWTRWAQFLGENKYTSWVDDTEYIIPHAAVKPTPGDLYDHMGLPLYETDELAQTYGLANGIPDVDTGFLAFRSFWLIWNEWYRNENTTDPVLVNTGDDVDAEEVERYRTLPHSAKPFDAFTAALPAPQKGDAVEIALGQAAEIPVYTKSDVHVEHRTTPLMFHTNLGPVGTGFLPVLGSVTTTLGQLDSVTEVDNSTITPGRVMAPANLYTTVPATDAVTINQLRQAFQMQRLLELQARTGTRLTEIIKASFGVQSPDARLQRPEYLGGATVKIQMQQVVQQSNTVDQESPLGRVGAVSKTVSSNGDFVHSFTEHGYVIGVLTARHTHTYQQGLHRMFSRRGRYDFYWPSFAHIGEQPIKRGELYYTGDPESDDVPFGYQEAWYEYRYKPNVVTGAFRSTVQQNLDEWHYADIYSAAPILSSGWMNATEVAVDRTLAVSSTMHDQLLFDISVLNKASRVMPLYSTPGLIDHF